MRISTGLVKNCQPVFISKFQKHTVDKTFKLTVPAHKPIKRSTLSHILKQADLSIQRFLELL